MLVTGSYLKGHNTGVLLVLKAMLTEFRSKCSGPTDSELEE